MDNLVFLMLFVCVCLLSMGPDKEQNILLRVYLYMPLLEGYATVSQLHLLIKKKVRQYKVIND